MKIKIAIIFTLFGVTSLLSAQENSLTKQQMYADFDKMIRIFEDCNAQLPVRKAITGIDQLKQAKELRSQIDTIKSFAHFYRLLRTALACMYDIHARQATDYLPDYDNLEGIDTAVIRNWRDIFLAKSNTPPDNFRWFPGNPICINGTYTIHGIYQCVESVNKDTIVLKNAKIIAYNGKPYKEYVQNNLTNFVQSGTRWDYERKEYYSITSNIPFSGILTLENGGKIIDFDLNKKYAINIQGACTLKEKDIPLKIEMRNEKKVLYFERDSILYVYIDKMSYPENEIPKKIKEVGSGKTIKKVIIDVRGNTGGGDKVWHNVLSAIVSDSLIYNPIMAFKNTKALKKLYSHDKAFTDISKFEVKAFKWLSKDEKFIVSTVNPIYFLPDSNSLKYNGKIYILQNEEVYSAGHSFTTYATHIKQLVSVGEPTGLLAGFGILPALFQLPYSKFTFRLETAIDISNAQTALDVYQDFPEILVKIPFDKKFEYLDDRCYDRQCEKYLYEHDYLFQKVLELK